MQGVRENQIFRRLFIIVRLENIQLQATKAMSDVNSLIFCDASIPFFPTLTEREGLKFRQNRNFRYNRHSLP